jgi:hypothetical protein
MNTSIILNEVPQDAVRTSGPGGFGPHGWIGNFSWQKPQRPLRPAREASIPNVFPHFGQAVVMKSLFCMLGIQMINHDT